jgi:acetyl-CoA carboxylase carboxyltransferase component
VIVILVADEAEAIAAAKKYLAYFCGPHVAGAAPDGRTLRDLVPENPRRAYDVRKVIAGLADTGSVLELKPSYGKAVVTSLMRLEGRPVGVIANQPMHLSGSIDNEASDKAARFIRFCDSYNLPLVFVVDTPGFMPGVEQEKGGIIKRGGRFLNAVVEADVPKVTITIRKSYGGAYAVMGSKQLSADLNFAWPTARIAVIGAEGAAQLLVKRFPDPTAPEVQKIRAEFIEGYNLNMATPWIAAERGFIDAVIQPHETRLLLRKSMRLLRDKQIDRVQRKHGLTPI